jgi:alkylhydroperoxidase/carboxymuconolactone decarboxylase family protein YurZ
MPSDDQDKNEFVAQLATEIITAVDQAGELESWVARRIDGSTDEAALAEASTQVAMRLLDVEPPITGAWEHLLVTLAVHSSRAPKHRGLAACRSIVRSLGDSLVENRLGEFDSQRVLTLACALTVALAIQDKLTQDIEETMRGLAERFPDALQEMAGQCQDIWMRRGQMSGKQGLFVWDTRRDEWRLAQDFKSYRSAN